MKPGATKMRSRSAKEIRQLLVGKRIKKVVLNPFSSGRPGQMAFAPVITLDDGTTLSFATQETDVGEYGTALVICPPEPFDGADVQGSRKEQS